MTLDAPKIENGQKGGLYIDYSNRGFQENGRYGWE